jgi:hypothetical protein
MSCWTLMIRRRTLNRHGDALHQLGSWLLVRTVADSKSRFTVS